MDEFEIVVAAAFGTEGVVKKELINLNVRNKIICENGRCVFSDTLQKAVDCCVFLRTAERVYLRLASANCESFDELYSLVSSVNWRDLIPTNAKLNISAKSHQSKLYALSALQSITKKAIIRSLCNSDDCILPENGADYRLQVSVLNNKCEILLDLCGSGLHRRGYRIKNSVAPIKETLAAAILLLSDYNGQTPLYDPFCGSGTFLTEGAQIAMNVAPGADRRFALEHYSFVDKRFLRETKEKAAALALTKPPYPITGSDIDTKQVELSRYHAERLGVSNYVTIEQKDALGAIPHSVGITVTNPPYGERILTRAQTSALYSAFGKTYQRYTAGHSLSVITAYERFEKDFGLKAQSNRKLFNGNIPCRLYFFGKSK